LQKIHFSKHLPVNFTRKIQMENDLFLAVDNYISGLFVKEDDALKAARTSIREADLPHDMSISSNQGSFLQLLVRLVRAERVLEIGTFVGYSTIWLARGLGPTGRLITLEFDPVHAGLARDNIRRAGVGDLVELRTGRGLDLLPGLVEESAGPFDLIFIDADKPPYADYYQWALKLSRPGTLIVFDNVIREGKVLDKETDDDKVAGVQRLNRMLAEDTRVFATIITSIGVKDYDGMALALVK
jgi:caffeoyl-CoA O-methyltransferase